MRTLGGLCSLVWALAALAAAHPGAPTGLPSSRRLLASPAAALPQPLAGPGDRPCTSLCTGPGCITNATLPKMTPLPLPTLSDGVAPWHAKTYSYKRLSIVKLGKTPDTRAMRVDYDPYGWGPVSGGDFVADPFKALPATSAALSYSVYFPPDFDFVLGGKLRGVCMSSDFNGCATGLRWEAGAGSARMMWRPTGRVVGYLYVPLQIGGTKGGASYAKAMRAQGAGYRAVASETGIKQKSGDDVWCVAQGGLQFRRGAWNNVTLVVALNTPGKKDGVLSITVNDDTRTISDMVWRSEDTLRINKVTFVTFFGGSNATWAPKRKQYALFRGFKFAAPVALTPDMLGGLRPGGG